MVEQKIKQTTIVSRSTTAERERKGRERESVCMCVLAPHEPLQR